jgi:hypothetical protein
MNETIRQLLAFAPGIAQGATGNGRGMQAFMESYQRTMAQLDAQERQQQSFTMQTEDRQRNITRQDAADKRLAEQDRIAAEGRQRQIGMQTAQLPGVLAKSAEGAETLPDAEQAIDALYRVMAPQLGGMEQLGGVRDVALNQARTTITARQKRQVSEFVDAALKTSFVADNQEADPEVTNLPSHIQTILGKPSAKLSELQTFAQLPVGKPAGKTRIPPAAGSMEEYSDPSTTPERKKQIEIDRKTYMQSDDRPRITVNTGNGLPPNVQRRLDAAIKGFDAQPIVKTIQKQAEAASLAESFDPNTKNPADDQALIYAFAKAMDPDSVVREGEYATIQKYSQSWAQTFGFDMARIFSNTAFLTPEARANMKATILAKYKVGRAQYDNVRNEYGRRIDRITGKTGGLEELTDYGAAFPQDHSAPMQKEIPGVPGSLAESTDGGKTWKRIK